MPRILLLAALAAAASLPAQGSRPQAPLDFGRDVRPLLSGNCFQCHGPDAAKRKGNLRLDVADGDLATKSTKRAVVPGDPAASELLRRVRGEGRRMPPA